MQATLKIATPTGDRTCDVQVSPYSYQHYPKTPSVLKASILGDADTPIALTKGRGRHYLYFKHQGRVEWFGITADAFKLIAGGAEVTVTAVTQSDAPAKSDRPAKPAKSDRPAKPAKSAKVDV
jgi:hypothetical protein